ncbi:ParA family protein [Acidianus manzaensis]|uniref:CobQ/CobB/MinD/ParA nucleotide binding domain-containing protein n=1 Tax=Acidianus manzaensis TaxID=282676 RepID=A0A1W6K2N9_9CREN|nr:ParA family protein [Acidianus manzaensis]ARM76747.1 hypothetical protein B6F84_12470 [Acidianus manzaensis]
MIVKVLSLKGGVGKSIIALYLAKYMAEKGKKILLIDNDNISLSSTLIEKSQINGVDIRKDMQSIPFDLLKNYDFIIIDYPTLFKEDKLDNMQDAVTILISDITTLDDAYDYFKNISGKKVFILNMVPPFPDYIEAMLKKVKEVDICPSIVIPFIPNMFLSVMRENKIKNDIRCLKTLSELLIQGNLNCQLISPLS